MRMSKRHRKEGTSEEWRLGALRRIVALFAALVVSLTLTAAATANVSFTKAYGWGVTDGASQFETCTSTCQAGIAGGGAGQFTYPRGVATDRSGDVYVADSGNSRIDEFSAGGAFIKAWGWGVSDGVSQFETCTSTCQAGIAGGGAGQLTTPEASPPIAPATSTSPTTATTGSTSSPPPARSSRPRAGACSNGASQFETCTSTCQAGIAGRRRRAVPTPGRRHRWLGRRLRRRLRQRPDR